MFSARAVSVEIEPESDSFVINTFHYELGGRYLMLPGEHSFSATKEGYYPLTKTLK